MNFGMIRSPPLTLPIPPCRRWTSCLPLFVLVRVSRHMWFFSCFLLQSLQGRQCLLEIRTISQWHSIGTLLFSMKPPFVLIVEVFLCSQMVSVIFIRKSIPSSTKFFVSMIFNHPITECLIVYESVMDSLEVSLLAFLLQLVSLVSWGLPFLMTYSGTERRSIVYLTNFRLTPVSLCKKCPHVQQLIPVFQYDRHALYCVLGSVSSNSHNSMLPTSWIICFWFSIEKIKWLILS